MYFVLVYCCVGMQMTSCFGGATPILGRNISDPNVDITKYNICLQNYVLAIKPLPISYMYYHMSICIHKQNRSIEGCSKLKRSVDMTGSGKNGLNIRTNASPKWDRTRCPEE